VKTACTDLNYVSQNEISKSKNHYAVEHGRIFNCISSYCLFCVQYKSCTAFLGTNYFPLLDTTIFFSPNSYLLKGPSHSAWEVMCGSLWVAFCAWCQASSELDPVALCFPDFLFLFPEFAQFWLTTALIMHATFPTWTKYHPVCEEIISFLLCLKPFSRSYETHLLVLITPQTLASVCKKISQSFVCFKNCYTKLGVLDPCYFAKLKEWRLPNTPSPSRMTILHECISWFNFTHHSY
jgi:hypothetical protein